MTESKLKTMSRYIDGCMKSGRTPKITSIIRCGDSHIILCKRGAALTIFGPEMMSAIKGISQ